MESQRKPDASPRDAEDLTPTPTQAENDAAMILASGGAQPDQQAKAAEHKPAAPAAHHEPERRPQH